jgi:GT2 family glycosyltransferase
MKILIVFTAKNCLDYTKEALATLKVSRPYHLMIVDDHSVDKTAEWLDSLNQSDFENAESLLKVFSPDIDSLAGRWNMALEKAKELGCEAVLICNNDILFAPYTVDTLIERLENTDESIGMVTANNIRDHINPADIVTHPQPVKDTATESENPDFSCFLIRVSVWEKIGRFDENYKPCYFEDNDTHSMMKIYNIKALNLPYAPYYHYGSRTQNSVPGGVCTPQQFQENRMYFIRKFGARPGSLNIERAKKRLGIVDE